MKTKFNVENTVDQKLHEISLLHPSHQMSAIGQEILRELILMRYDMNVVREGLSAQVVQSPEGARLSSAK